jgi:hypothetical protein
VLVSGLRGLFVAKPPAREANILFLRTNSSARHSGAHGIADAGIELKNASQGRFIPMGSKGF